MCLLSIFLLLELLYYICIWKNITLLIKKKNNVSFKVDMDLFQHANYIEIDWPIHLYSISFAPRRFALTTTFQTLCLDIHSPGNHCSKLLDPLWLSNLQRWFLNQRFDLWDFSTNLQSIFTLVEDFLDSSNGHVTGVVALNISFIWEFTEFGSALKF